MNIEFSDKAILQWFNCAQTFLIFPEKLGKDLCKKWQNNPPQEILEWYHTFFNDVFISRWGYPLKEIFHEPYTEIFILKFLKKQKLLKEFQEKKSQATLCLTHDVDHLAPSLKLTLKNLVAEKKLFLYKRGDHFLTSLEKLLNIDREISGNLKPSTLFLASPLYSPSILDWPIQWLVDPSYTVGHPLLKSLDNLIATYNCILGVHGSIFSLKRNLLGQEKKLLEASLNRQISFVRQHWLHLPTADALLKIKQTGFKMDSTLGWNGHCGFRGGMARPFPIVLTNKEDILWELPLLVMDGPLLNSKTERLAQNLLEKVFKHKGVVAVNWHERAAHPKHQWDALYKEVLRFSVEKGFIFKNMQEIADEIIP